MATAVATPVANGTDRRRSGRAKHAPSVFSQEHYHGSVIDSAKRKRTSDAVNGDDAADEDDEMEEDVDDDDEDEPDEEELRETRRKKRSSRSVAKPAAKRPKMGAGSNTTLAIRSANAPSKTISRGAKQKARSRPSQVQATGLYADVFGKGLSAEAAANSWHSQMETNNVVGIRNAVNFLIQVAGCEGTVDDADIDDPDNIPNRLGDILTEYAHEQQPDYPLSGKQKQYHGMKEVFSDFFRAIVHSLHNSEKMYNETAIYENLFTWTATMSAASYRSFRYTATSAALAMVTGQCELGNEIRAGIATTKQQLDAERKKKKANAGRVNQLQQIMADEESKLALIDEQIKDAFDTVFVHRYRDVDERLRVECVTALGTWILTYRVMFLEGAYLRYLGWVMSDPHAPTRLEVVKALKKIYAQKTNLPALRGFTDRFRERIVEMGSRDADLNVRIETIDLLNRLRGADLLEPEDIDTIGKLIFDNEPRVRKAVAQFFVSNIEDLYSASVEDFDAADFNEALPDVDSTEDFDEPSKLWIKFKCLAQTLNAQTKDLASNSKKLEISGIEQLDSRYMVATQAMFGSMPELQQWETLAGYLLYDHSSIGTGKDTSGIALAVQEAYKLEQGEDLVLLDVLFCAAKLTLQELAADQKSGKLKKTQKDEVQAKQETAAHNLSVFIPQLHSKYGTEAIAAKSILRLHQLFDPDLVDDDVDEGQGDQSALLDDVDKQFTNHSDAEVLAEAGRALRTALLHESSKEAADKKINELWQDLLTHTLAPLLAGQNISARGTMDRQKTAQLAEVTGRLAQLASVKDCCEVIEGKMISGKSKRKNNESLMDVMLQLVKRGEPDEDTPPEAAKVEDRICRFATRILSLYYRWKVVTIRGAIASNNKSQLSTGLLTNLAMHKSDLIEALMPVIASRKPLDSVRSAAMLSLLDLYVLFATLRHMKPSKGQLDEDIETNLQSLVTEFNSTAMTAILETHEKMEERLARHTNKKNIELPLRKAHKAQNKPRRASAGTPAATSHNIDDEEIERPPEDSDDEDAGRNNDSDHEPSSDDGDDIDSSPEEGGSAKEAKKKAALVAETSLCELTAKIVLAILAGVVPKSNEIKVRLQLNRTRLGKSYTQVIAYLDDKKEKNKPKPKPTDPRTPVKKSVNGKGPSGKKATISDAVVIEEDDIEDPSEDDDDLETLRERGLDDDPVEEDGDDDGADRAAAADEEEDIDDVMGD